MWEHKRALYPHADWPARTTPKKTPSSGPKGLHFRGARRRQLPELSRRHIPRRPLSYPDEHWKGSFDMVPFGMVSRVTHRGEPLLGGPGIMVVSTTSRASGGQRPQVVRGQRRNATATSRRTARSATGRGARGDEPGGDGHGTTTVCGRRRGSHQNEEEKEEEEKEKEKERKSTQMTTARTTRRGTTTTRTTKATRVALGSEGEDPRILKLRALIYGKAQRRRGRDPFALLPARPTGRCAIL